MLSCGMLSCGICRLEKEAMVALSSKCILNPQALIVL